MKIGVHIGFGTGHSTDAGPPLQNGHSPPFWPISVVACGQMARWINMPLGRKVGLDSSDIVLDADTAPLSPKGDRAPDFRHIYIVAKRLHELK